MEKKSPHGEGIGQARLKTRSRILGKDSRHPRG